MGIEKGNQILRIIELRAENVKRLKAVTITPEVAADHQEVSA